MGLDISLYTAEQSAKNRAYSEASDALYEDGPDGKSPRDKMSDEEYTAWREQYSYTGHDDPPSGRYPDHLFNRRYLRSSYNGSGFDRAVPDLLASTPQQGPTGFDVIDTSRIPESSKPQFAEPDVVTGEIEGDGEHPTFGTLAWIFEPVRLPDQYEIELTAASIGPLGRAKERALHVAEALRACDRLRVMTISHNFLMGVQPASDADALRLYREQVQRHGGAIEEKDGWWSSRDINVFGGGLSVLAAVPGLGVFKEPGVHLVYRMSDEGFDSYVQSAEITAEFCDEAISLIERDGSCEMSWSG